MQRKGVESMNQRVKYRTANNRKNGRRPIRLSKVKVSFFVSIIIFLCFAAIQGVSAIGSVNSVDTQYRSVLISDGDTLWNIADEHNDKSLSDMSNKEYIKEIERINKIRSDSITAGNYIIVPIFVAVDK